MEEGSFRKASQSLHGESTCPKHPAGSKPISPRKTANWLSYVLFPQVVREFLEWRAGGAGIENEIVAALAAALTHDRRPAEAPAAADGERSPWKMAGRQRLLRGR